MSEKNYEELFIFNRMAGGDKDAFRFFFDKYYTDLCAFVNFYTQSLDMSEEIVQGIYVYFWENRANIKIASSVKSYLYSSVKNKGLNYLRNKKNKSKIHDALAGFDQTYSWELSDLTIDREWIFGLVDQAIGTLPPKCREIFLMAKEKELSYKEIAGQLNISAKTVENQMGKAFKLIRDFMRPYYNEIFSFAALMAFLCVEHSLSF